MKAIGVKAKLMALEFIQVQMGSSFMKENGKTISKVDKVLNLGLMAAFMKAALNSPKRTDMGLIFGLMETNILEIGRTMKSME